jgi:hypothetical protein
MKLQSLLHSFNIHNFLPHLLPDHMASFFQYVQNEKQKYRKDLSNAYFLIDLQTRVRTHTQNEQLDAEHKICKTFSSTLHANTWSSIFS